MDIEKLTKSQIILLTLFCSFVTSIATGIVTVSLMDQAAPIIAQTLEHVVERTTAPPAAISQGALAAKPTEKTVLIREADLIPQAVAHLNQSLVRLYTGPADNLTYIGLGIVVTKDGLIATDLAVLPDEGQSVWVIGSSGASLSVKVVSRGRETSVALLQASSAAAAWRPASLSNTTPSLGQSVISIAGRSSVRVGQGIVSAYSSTGTGKDAPQNIIDTTLLRESYSGGSPIIDVSGNVLGISTSASRETSGGAFVASSALIAHINALTADGKPFEKP